MTDATPGMMGSTPGMTDSTPPSAPSSLPSRNAPLSPPLTLSDLSGGYWWELDEYLRVASESLELLLAAAKNSGRQDVVRMILTFRQAVDRFRADMDSARMGDAT